MKIIFNNFKNKFLSNRNTVTEMWGPTRRAQDGGLCVPWAPEDPPGMAPSLQGPRGQSYENIHMFLKSVTVQFRGKHVDPCSLPM